MQDDEEKKVKAIFLMCAQYIFIRTVSSLVTHSMMQRGPNQTTWVNPVWPGIGKQKNANLYCNQGATFTRLNELDRLSK